MRLIQNLIQLDQHISVKSSYPIADAVTLAPACTPSMVNLPSSSAAAPKSDSSTTTLAPATDLPVDASVTMPDNVNTCSEFSDDSSLKSSCENEKFK